MCNDTSNATGDARRIRITVAYDGAGFAGWQLQPDEPTVQGALERALEKLTGTQVRVTGAGRTDAGVHAIGQTAHFDNSGRLGPDELERALNAILPRTIRVREAKQVSPEFHARFGALWKIYRYGIAAPSLPDAVLLQRTHWIRKAPEELAALNKCCGLLLGEHDFFSFSKQEGHRENHKCVIHDAGWSISEGRLYFEVKGDRFLRGMVRMLVGGMLAVADGRAGIDEFSRALEHPGRWKEAVPAPPEGLTLVRVYYDGDQL